jgi:hypothetical protein
LAAILSVFHFCLWCGASATHKRAQSRYCLGQSLEAHNNDLFQMIFFKLIGPNAAIAFGAVATAAWMALFASELSRMF